MQTLAPASWRKLLYGANNGTHIMKKTPMARSSWSELLWHPHHEAHYQGTHIMKRSPKAPISWSQLSYGENMAPTSWSEFPYCASHGTHIMKRTPMVPTSWTNCHGTHIMKWAPRADIWWASKSTANVNGCVKVYWISHKVMNFKWWYTINSYVYIYVIAVLGIYIITYTFNKSTLSATVSNFYNVWCW